MLQDLTTLLIAYYKLWKKVSYYDYPKNVFKTKITFLVMFSRKSSTVNKIYQNQVSLKAFVSLCESYSKIN